MNLQVAPAKSAKGFVDEVRMRSCFGADVATRVKVQESGGCGF